MACLICKSVNAQECIQEYLNWDKYEKYIGIDDIYRHWWKCGNCGHYSQSRNYPLEKLEKIYQHGYRDEAFRGKTIQQQHGGVDGSENLIRVDWFLKHTSPGTLLDIGSGLGIFPESLTQHKYSVQCQEENELSRKFITEQLGFPCHAELPNQKFEIVSLVHVLEHIEKPDEFLARLRKMVTCNLFVEVPDAREFAYLPKAHDEFNSCHLWFFTLQNLITLIERNGFTVVEASRKFYPQRELSRILVVAS